jgi:hypothetical protein
MFRGNILPLFSGTIVVLKVEAKGFTETSVAIYSTATTYPITLIRYKTLHAGEIFVIVEDVDVDDIQSYETSVTGRNWAAEFCRWQ